MSNEVLKQKATEIRDEQAEAASGVLTDGVFYRCLTYENGNLSGTNWKQISTSYE